MDCKKCGESFVKRIWVDGRERDLSKRKYCLDCSPFDKHNTKQLNKPKANELLLNCTLCGKEYIWRKRGHVATKTQCTSCKVNHRRFRLKKKFLAYLGDKCVVCGYNKCSSALEFHHLDPSTKRFSIGGNHCRRWEIVKEELDKCVILCSNCHREVDAGIASIPEDSTGLCGRPL